jgi:hypothetical protein
MKLTPWYLAAIAPIAIAGCSGTVLGHMAVLAVTFGIFFGTLTLGKNTTATTRVNTPLAAPSSDSLDG